MVPASWPCDCWPHSIRRTTLRDTSDWTSAGLTSSRRAASVPGDNSWSVPPTNFPSPTPRSTWSSSARRWSIWPSPVRPSPSSAVFVSAISWPASPGSRRGAWPTCFAASTCNRLGSTPGHLQRFTRTAFRRLVGARFELVAERRPIPWTVLLARVPEPELAIGVPRVCKRKARRSRSDRLRDPAAADSVAMAGAIINRRILQHGLVGLLFALGTLILTYPLSVHPASLVRDPGDPLLFAWILAWMTKAIFSDPLHLFQANTFYPFPDSLAFTDAPLAIVPIAAPVIWLTGNPVLAVNVATFVAFVPSGFFTYLLARHLTRSTSAGIVAGIVFAFAPYRIAHLGHLQLLTSQWMPLALLFLHRGLASRRWRDFWGFAACFLLQSLSALYYMLFLAVAVGIFAALRRTPLPASGSSSRSCPSSSPRRFVPDSCSSHSSCPTGEHSEPMGSRGLSPRSSDTPPTFRITSRSPPTIAWEVSASPAKTSSIAST